MLKLTTLFMAGAFVALSACQDPLRDESEQVRNGHRPDAVKPPPPPGPDLAAVAREVMIVEVDPSVMNFTEGEEATFTLTGRLLDREDTFTLSILDLPRGATFDAAKGTLKWKAPLDTLKGNEFVTMKTLTVRMTTNSAPYLASTVTFPYWIKRSASGPTITGMPVLRTIREGDTQSFSITVKDNESVDAGPTGQSVPPMVQIVPTAFDASNFAPYVRMTGDPVQSLSDPTSWTYPMEVNLRGVEVTSQLDTKKFGLMAVSVVGTVSSTYAVTVNVLTKAALPKSTWQDNEWALTGGEQSVMNFSVYAPRSGVNGQIESSVAVQWITNCSSLPGAALCTCVRSPLSGDDTQDCKIAWKPLPTTSGTFTFDFKATNTNKFSTSDIETANFRRTVTVRAAPTPPPPPPPPPPAMAPQA